MTRNRRTACWLLLAVTGLAEAGTGLALLAVPAVPLRLLLGAETAGPELAVMARVAGAALLAVGVASWLARGDGGGELACGSPAQRGLLTGVLIYDVAAAGLLTYAGSVSGMSGDLLWPAVAVHAALAVWCAACLRAKPATGIGS